MFPRCHFITGVKHLLCYYSHKQNYVNSVPQSHSASSQPGREHSCWSCQRSPASWSSPAETGRPEPRRVWRTAEPPAGDRRCWRRYFLPDFRNRICSHYSRYIHLIHFTPVSVNHRSHQTTGFISVLRRFKQRWTRVETTGRRNVIYYMLSNVFSPAELGFTSTGREVFILTSKEHGLCSVMLNTLTPTVQHEQLLYFCASGWCRNFE